MLRNALFFGSSVYSDVYLSTRLLANNEWRTSAVGFCWAERCRYVVGFNSNGLPVRSEIRKERGENEAPLLDVPCVSH